MSATGNNFVCKTEFDSSEVVLGILLTVGIVISFLPQVIVMILRKNVDGLSVIMCWLNYANCMGTFVNVLFLNWFVFRCCSWLSPWNCFRNLLAVIQLTPPFICSFIIFLLYVIYRPRLTREQINENSKIVPNNPPIKYHEQNSSTLASSEKPLMIDNSINNSIDNNSNNNNDNTINNSSINNVDSNNNNENNISISLNSEESSNHEQSSGSGSSIKEVKNNAVVNDSNIENNFEKDSKLPPQPKNKVDAFIIKMDYYSQPLFWGSIVLTVIMFAVGVGIVYGIDDESKALEVYAFSCGIFALVLVFLQWIPQIYTTIIANEIGSLSLVSVCIQAPGAFLVMYFQIDSKQNWSTWVPYLATGIQMIVLIVICVYYLIRDRKKNKKLKEQKEKGQIQDGAPQTYQAEKTI